MKTNPKNQTNQSGTLPPVAPKSSSTESVIAKVDGMTDRQQAAAFCYLTGVLGVALKPNSPIFTSDKMIEFFNNAVDYGRTQ